jgi:hypothetical protein
MFGYRSGNLREAFNRREVPSNERTGERPNEQRQPIFGQSADITPTMMFLNGLSPHSERIGRNAPNGQAV